MIKPKFLKEWNPWFFHSALSYYYSRRPSKKVSFVPRDDFYVYSAGNEL